MAPSRKRKGAASQQQHQPHQQPQERHEMEEAEKEPPVGHIGGEPVKIGCATAPRRLVAKVGGGAVSTVMTGSATTPRIRATISRPGSASAHTATAASTHLPKIVLKPGAVLQHRQQVKQLFVAFQTKDTRNFETVAKAVIDSLGSSGVSGPSHPLLALYETEMFDEKFTWSLLHAAAYYSNLKAVKFLMSIEGADVEVRDTWYGGTPLAWAAFGGHAPMCRLLIETYGASPYMQNSKGQVPVDLLSEPNDKKWRGLLYDVPEEPIEKPPENKATQKQQPKPAATIPGHLRESSEMQPSSVPSTAQVRSPGKESSKKLRPKITIAASIGGLRRESVDVREEEIRPPAGAKSGKPASPAPSNGEDNVRDSSLGGKASPTKIVQPTIKTTLAQKAQPSPTFASPGPPATQAQLPTTLPTSHEHIKKVKPTFQAPPAYRTATLPSGHLAEPPTMSSDQLSTVPLRQQIKQLFTALETRNFETVANTVIESLGSSGVSGPSHQLLALYETELFDQKFTWSLLHAAAYYNNLKAVKTLMSIEGADVEVRDTWYGGTPLAWAAFGGHAPMCRLLIEAYGASPYTQNSKGQVPTDLLSEPNEKKWRGLLYDIPEPQVEMPPENKTAQKQQPKLAVSMPGHLRESSEMQPSAVPTTQAKSLGKDSSKKVRPKITIAASIGGLQRETVDVGVEQLRPPAAAKSGKPALAATSNGGDNARGSSLVGSAPSTKIVQPVIKTTWAQKAQPSPTFAPPRPPAAQQAQLPTTPITPHEHIKKVKPTFQALPGYSTTAIPAGRLAEPPSVSSDQLSTVPQAGGMVVQGPPPKAPVPVTPVPFGSLSAAKHPTKIRPKITIPPGFGTPAEKVGSDNEEVVEEGSGVVTWAPTQSMKQDSTKLGKAVCLRFLKAIDVRGGALSHHFDTTPPSALSFAVHLPPSSEQVTLIPQVSPLIRPTEHALRIAVMQDEKAVPSSPATEEQQQHPPQQGSGPPCSYRVSLRPGTNIVHVWVSVTMPDDELDKAQRAARELAGLPVDDDDRNASRHKKKRRKDEPLMQQYTLFLFRFG